MSCKGSYTKSAKNTLIWHDSDDIAEDALTWFIEVYAQFYASRLDRLRPFDHTAAIFAEFRNQVL